jgi:hypothetical protein
MSWGCGFLGLKVKCNTASASGLRVIHWQRGLECVTLESGFSRKNEDVLPGLADSTGEQIGLRGRVMGRGQARATERRILSRLIGPSGESGRGRAEARTRGNFRMRRSDDLMMVRESWGLDLGR